MLIDTGTFFLLVSVILCDWAFVQCNDQFLESVLGTKITTKPGRHVCTTEKIISRPIQIQETYKRPIYVPHPRDCVDFHYCPQFDVRYETTNRTVFKLQKSSSFRHSCCPGWTHESRREKGCMAPICTNGCGEFGVCTKPDVCQCRTGFTGEMCDNDVDECLSNNHDCQQICKNTAGSYMCACQKGFTLDANGKTCNYCYTCQEEYTSLVLSVEEMKNHLADSMSRQKEQMEKIQNASVHDKMHELEEKVEFLEEENTMQRDIMVRLNDTYVENIKVLEQELKTLAQKNVDQTQLLSLQTDSIRETLEGLEQRVRDLTEKNTLLQRNLTTIQANYEKVFKEIKQLKEEEEAKITQNTLQSSTTTKPPDTTAKANNPGGLQFSYDDIIYSLSNQIGMMEEKLELCNCVPRYGP